MQLLVLHQCYSPVAQQHQRRQSVEGLTMTGWLVTLVVVVVVVVLKMMIMIISCTHKVHSFAAVLEVIMLSYKQKREKH